MRFLSGLLLDMYHLLMSVQVGRSLESFRGATIQDSAFEGARVELKFVVFTFFTISDSLGVLSSLPCLVDCFCVFSQGHEFAESIGVTVRDSVLVRARVLVVVVLRPLTVMKRVGLLVVLMVTMLGGVGIIMLRTMASFYMFVQTRSFCIRLWAARNLALVRARILVTADTPRTMGSTM